MKPIKLGYELGTGKQIDIQPSHLIVTGLSQKAGKTTTLESMIKRSGQKAIVFRTKIGEKSFLDGTVIPPYFKDRSDWQYIESLIEATMKEKVGRMERAKIIQISKKTSGKSLLEFKKVVDERLLDPKINNFEKDLLTNLQAYLEIVIPKLQSIQFNTSLDLVDGLNIIDLERFSRDPEVQSLIIGSVLDEVLNSHKNTICLIPEAWKFIPQSRGNPCKHVVEEFIRQGATNKNFLWIDSQDMTGVDKIPLKQISEWILGYQSEKNEVKHTIDQIPLPKQSKPTADEIMQLGTGIFIYASRDLTARVYVQPFWLDDEKSKDIALGKLHVDEIDAPKQISQNKIMIHHPETGKAESVSDEKLKEIKKMFGSELTGIRTDFFNKIGDIQDQLNKAFVDIGELKLRPTQPEIDEDLLIGKVLQKLPTPMSAPVTESKIDQENLVNLVLARIPKNEGATVYNVAPLEKITKDFLNEAKAKIIGDIGTLNNDSKKILKYLESQGKSAKPTELITKCLLMKDGGTQRNKITNCTKELTGIEVIKKDSHGLYPKLKERITDLIGNHKATESEIEATYNHILMELL